MDGLEQELDKKDKELLDLIYKRLEIWKDACKEFHDRAREARKIILLQDPRQDSPKAKVKTVQLQTLKSTFNNCVADQVDNVMESKMVPETPQLQEVADDLNDIVRYIYEYNDYPALHRQRVQDYLGVGTAVTQVMWDEEAQHGKGEVALIRVPVEQFLWDGAEADIQDARALMKVSWHPMSWYESHYPGSYPFINADEHASYAVGEQENQQELYTDEKKAMLIEYWWRTYDSKKKKYTINVAYAAGKALLYKQENVYAHGMYPFVIDAHTEIEGLPVGDGIIMELAPMMRYINRYYKYMDKNIRESSHTRWLINKSANINADDVADWDNDFIYGDRITADGIQPLVSPGLTNLALSTALQMETDLKQDSGQSEFSRGETAGGVTAATAIASLQEAGGKQTRMRTERLKRGFRRITEQVLWLISEFYDDKRVIQITGKDNRLRVVDESPRRLMGRKGTAVPPPPYIVRVEVERMNPNAVSEQNQLFIDAYKMSAEAQQVFPLSALFRMLNVDGKDKILPIIESVENYTQTLQSMTEQNRQLQATVQQQQQSIDGLKNSLLSVQKQTNTAGAPSPIDNGKSALAEQQ